MSRRNGVLLVVLQAGMEISWLHACASFVSLAVVGRSLSLGNAVIAFAAGAVATFVTLGRGWRVIAVLAVQIVCLAGVVGVVIYSARYASYPLFATEWLREAFRSPRPLVQWMDLVVVLLSILLFWVCGVFLARRKMSYSSICSRFDLGLASFFSVYLIEVAILFKGGRVVENSGATYSLFSFFLLGLLAVGVARVKGTASKGFLPGYGVAGIVAGFSAIVLFATGSILLFCLPALRKTAELGYSVMEAGGRSIAPFAIGALRFLFGPRGTRPEPSSSSPAALDPRHFMTPDTWWGHYLQVATEWGVKGFVAAVLLFSTAFLIVLLVRWLLARTRVSEQQAERPGRLGDLLLRLWTTLLSLLRRARWRLKGYGKAADLYGALLSWGRRSGIPLERSDTPAEFGDRLRRHYPGLDGRISSIVVAFNKEVYGGMVPTVDELARVRADLRSLRSPRHWPRRLRVRVFARSMEGDRPGSPLMR